MKSLINIHQEEVHRGMDKSLENAKDSKIKLFGFFEGIIIAMFIVGLSILLFSCSEEEPITYDKQITYDQANVKEVRMVGQWFDEGKRGKLIRDFARLYEFENQHIRVDLKFPEEFLSDHADRTSNVRFVADQVRKSEPDWDIIRLNNQLQPIGAELNDPDWARKYLVDFSTVPGFKENTNPKLLTDEYREQWGGIIPGPFLEGSYWALWTNDEVEKKLGIQVKRKGMTVDDFLSYLRAVKKYNESHPEDYIIPMHEAGDWQTSFTLAYQLFASALNNNEVLNNTEPTEEKLLAWHTTLKVLEEIAKLNAYSPNWKNVVWSESNKDLLEGKCLFYSNGSWMYNIWEMDDSELVKKAYPNEYPKVNESVIYPSAYFIVWGVLKKSPNKDEAVKMLMAMNSPDIADMWVQYTKCPTGIKGNMSDVMFGKDQFDDFAVHVQKYYGDNIYNFSEDLCTNIFGSHEMGKNHYRDVLEGALSADEAMERIRTYVNN